MEIGTNRPDAMNHYGVAREASALYNLPLKPIQPKLPQPKRAASFPIEIEDPKDGARASRRACHSQCRRSSRRPKKIVASPGAARSASRSTMPSTLRITSLWEMGNPTHVFDLDLLEGGKIIVRRARDGETLKTLDGVERKLTPEDLVVADAKKPWAWPASWADSTP